MTTKAKRQRGAAVILAMSVAALAAIAATAVLATQGVWTREQELSADHAQARALVGAAIDWSRSVLADDARADTVDHPGEAWALRLAPVAFDNGRIGGHVADQQGLFNLNNLVVDGRPSLAHVRQFVRLLDALGLSPALADALVDWLDADGEPHSAAGAEDRYYLALEPPYVAANRALADVSELALVRGYDDATRARLRGYVTALPRATPVNVNTAPPEVLAALAGIDIDQARAVAAQRRGRPFRDAAEFLGALPTGVEVRRDDVAVASGFFAVSVHARIGESQAAGTALLARGRTGWPEIVWRRFQ
jgi:general secretion pathway protein K